MTQLILKEAKKAPQRLTIPSIATGAGRKNMSEIFYDQFGKFYFANCRRRQGVSAVFAPV